MEEALMWIGIALTVIGWLALAKQASKRISMKEELERFPQKKELMRQQRNYCWMIIGAGIAVLIIAVLI